MSLLNYQICKFCIMDTSDPEIYFDLSGQCNHCSGAINRMAKELLPENEKNIALENLINMIKKEGKGKEYDCIIGVSGGVDSTMVAVVVKKLGLRPLAVHFDNGWNSELAVDNIKRTVEQLNIDLYTHVVDWEEFRDLQLCFLKASVANCETPTDHAISALLFKMASKVGTRYILSGSNLVTEAIMPNSWGHYNQDLKHIKGLHKIFGGKALNTIPLISLFDYLYYVFFKRIRQIPFLNFIDFNKDKAKEILSRELGWRDYGGKHYESVWTRFFQGYYLPIKFGYDKRRAHLSTLICSGQIDRIDALEKIKLPSYSSALLKNDMDFILKKFGLNKDQFETIMNTPKREAKEYPSNYFLFHKLHKYKNIFRKIATTA
jgi:N-acetyl sugar amidotransferase